MSNNSINTIVFSFDRAMQLSLLLESIVRHDIHQQLNVHILFCCSAPDYRQAYAKLQNQYPQFYWLEETTYARSVFHFDWDGFYWHNYYWWVKYGNMRKSRSNFKQALVNILTGSTDNFVMFLTDDSLFYRNIEIPGNFAADSFSLRHGAHLSGGKYRQEGNFIRWNVYENDSSTEWGYPFSVDGHVYPKDKLLKIIRKILFNNPNTMEGNIACHVKEKRLFAQLAAGRESCLVGFELNRVQTVANNNHLGISQQLLNRHFLAGYTIKIDFDGENVTRFRPEIRRITVQRDNEQITILQR
jgi:hypothetical protein